MLYAAFLNISEIYMLLGTFMWVGFYCLNFKIK
jgi:hypothetical protein